MWVKNIILVVWCFKIEEVGCRYFDNSVVKRRFFDYVSFYYCQWCGGGGNGCWCKEYVEGIFYALVLVFEIWFWRIYLGKKEMF